VVSNGGLCGIGIVSVPPLQNNIQIIGSEYIPLVQLKSISTSGAGSDSFCGIKYTAKGKSNVLAVYHIV
jgi:hypothetical protein